MGHVYLPIKVLDKEYADKLMCGEVYMRPLEEFGSWRITEYKDLGGKELNNDFRGDIGEGLVRNLAPDEKHPFFDGLSEQMKEAVIGRYFIDEEEKETRLFSMAKLEYDVEKHSYKEIDKRFSEFGDTVVIILDPEAFYQRICACYHRMFASSFVVEVGEISYKSIFRDFGEWGLYVKEKKYEWQQEVRIAARLRPDIQILSNREKTGPIPARIGDLSDIAIEVPIKEILDGKWPEKIMDEQLLQKISQSQTPQMGITGYTLVFTGNFEEIGPYEEWITYWKEKLNLDNWTAVTSMEGMKGGKGLVPRLEFVENNGKGKLSFLYQEVQLHEDLTGDKDFSLGSRLSDVLKEGFTDQYIPTRCALIMNLGEVDGKYNDKVAITDRFIRIENNQQVLYGLEKGFLRYRNVFGFDQFDLKWRAIVECVNQKEADGKVFLQENLDRAHRVFQALTEGSDVYEQYHKNL